MKNFFERQDEARRNTKTLVALFVLAVVLIVAALYGVGTLVMLYVTGTYDPVQPVLLMGVLAATAAVVGGGSTVKTMSLRQGGHVVAESLGGRRISTPQTLQERQLLNVVEEMSIASGVPVPPVYVLEEDGINAFAAGHTTDDAVIGVTRGCVELLDRAELQGVIAHEFSHILNGDMRINIRLMGVLHGILLIGLIGRLILRTTAYSGGSRRDSDNKLRVAILAAGLAMLVIGGAGFFCGRLIKAAVSRQREYLADAAAVQFTRNPNGIGGALKKIGGHTQGATVEARKAEEASHLFFGDAIERSFFTSLFATHPPLDDRIRRILPAFDGDFPSVEPPSDEERKQTSSRLASSSSGPRSAAATSSLHGGDGASQEPACHGRANRPRRVVDRAGTVLPEDVERSAAILNALPPVLRETVHEPLGAVAVAYGLVLDADPAMRERQMGILRKAENESVVSKLEEVASAILSLDRGMRLPLLDLAAPALRDLSDRQSERLQTVMTDLVRADDQTTIFEYAVQAIVRHRMEHVAHPAENAPRFKRFKDVEKDATDLLSVLAHAGHRDEVAVRRAFREAMRALPVGGGGAQDPSPIDPDHFDRALDRLADTAPALKADVVEACAACVLFDDTVTPAEADLLRVVTVALDCPLPPSFDTMSVA